MESFGPIFTKEQVYFGQNSFLTASEVDYQVAFLNKD